MKIYNTIDEAGRMVRLPKYEISKRTGQYLSHTNSYVGARIMFQEQLDYFMGLDKLVNALINMEDSQMFLNKEIKLGVLSKETQENYLHSLNNFNFCSNYLRRNGLTWKDLKGDE